MTVNPPAGNRPLNPMAAKYKNSCPAVADTSNEWAGLVCDAMSGSVPQGVIVGYGSTRVGKGVVAVGSDGSPQVSLVPPHKPKFNAFARSRKNSSWRCEPKKINHFENYYNCVPWEFPDEHRTNRPGEPMEITEIKYMNIDQAMLHGDGETPARPMTIEEIERSNAEMRHHIERQFASGVGIQNMSFALALGRRAGRTELGRVTAMGSVLGFLGRDISGVNFGGYVSDHRAVITDLPDIPSSGHCMKVEGIEIENSRLEPSSRDDLCPETPGGTGKHDFTPDLEYDNSGNTINCERCGALPSENKSDSV